MEEGKLYYSITEVANELGVNASVLRFWEKQFDCIKPHKNKKGNRSYTTGDIDILRRIQYLTKECGFTLEGAREQLRSGDMRLDPKVQLAKSLTEIRSFLVELKEQI